MQVVDALRREIADLSLRSSTDVSRPRAPSALPRCRLPRFLFHRLLDRIQTSDKLIEPRNRQKPANWVWSAAICAFRSSICCWI